MLPRHHLKGYKESFRCAIHGFDEIPFVVALWQACHCALSEVVEDRPSSVLLLVTASNRDAKSDF